MPNKMERFSQRARRAMTAAQQEAISLGHQHIGPEHLLLGLLSDADSLACRVLQHFDLDDERIRQGINIAVGGAAESPDPRSMDLNRDTQKSLEYAVDEARRMGHQYIGTEHLLLGILRQPNAAVKIITALAVEPDALRQEVHRVLTAKLQDTEEAAPIDTTDSPVNLAKLREEQLKLMQRSLATLGHILDGITQEDATTWRDQNDAPNGWTVLDVLCHLEDYDRIFRERAQMILAHDNPTLPAYDHEQLKFDNAYAEQDMTEVYARLSASRSVTHQFFEALDPALWGRAGIHPERGHFTLMDALIQVGMHDCNHLEQIARIIRERKA